VYDHPSVVPEPSGLREDELNPTSDVVQAATTGIVDPSVTIDN
jgi:hypothetical protein